MDNPKLFKFVDRLGDVKRYETDITLRDLFAMHALANLACCEENTPDGVAGVAYEIADAMLEARK